MAGQSGVEKNALEAISRDSRLEGAQLRVVADEGGVVRLWGEVETFDKKVVAQEIIERVRGVRDIDNEVAVIPKKKRSDDRITKDIQAALRRCAWVEETKFGIETVNGVVFLKGLARNERERVEVEKDARWNAGVVDVVNEIVIHDGDKPEDKVIERDARASLIKNTRLNMTEVNITVAKGEARLTGKVPSFVLKRISEYVVFTVPGVINVANELTVGPIEGRRSVAA